MAVSYFICLENTVATVHAAASSTAASNQYTWNNLLLRTRPFKTYRSSGNPSSTSVFVAFDLGAGSPDLAAVFIDNLNVERISVKQSNDGTTFSAFSTFTNIVVPKDRHTGRYKAYLDFTVNGTVPAGFTNRYIQIGVQNSTPVKAPLTQLEMGAVTFVGLTQQLSFPGGYSNDIEIKQLLPRKVTQFDGGTTETIIIGEKRAQIIIPTREYMRDTQEAEFLNILNNNTNPILFYENDGDISRAYTTILDLDISGSIKYSTRKSLGGGITLNEV